ncbi:MAG: transketolase [Acidimicrobiales bacterium]|nr:transketolase [Acidimicrobiales bacterium]
MTPLELEQRGVSVIRGLAMDAPHAARSGHQGTAMALAPLAHVLWTRIMRYDATDPEWPDRDRFVLSAGHASILLYSMLHLTGFGLTLDDLKDFRQWASRTPGHPERGHTTGVEVTTGPLGQGIGNAVGMAIAERSMRARFGADVVDHRTFCIVGDGDLSEGLSHEAASLAGHLGLGHLVCVYDDNHISIDGPTELALTDDAARRFEAYGWHVEVLGEVADDLDALEAGLRRAVDVDDRPSLLILRSHIAAPSPTKTDDHEAHGYALKDDDIRATKEVLGLPVDESFYVPDDVLELYRTAGARGADEREAWAKRYEAYEGDRVGLAACLGVEGLDGWRACLPSWEPGEAVATRKASGACLQALAEVVPALVAGGADLTGNTGTALTGFGTQSRDEPGGRQIYFGIREHAMAAAMTGMALHGGVLPVGGTFLVFSDYCRPSIRLAALSRAKVIYSFSHDSVGVGEDGPTHQPIEHVASLRTIPGLRVIRPADANETALAWQVAVELEGPTALILSRQDVPVLAGTADGLVARGGYAVVPELEPDVVLVGTGSEVAVCVSAAQLLTAEGLRVQVSSLPCWELFAAQAEEYQDEVLPPEVPTLAVEAGASFGWDRWADDTVAIDQFGASAPGEQVLAELGYTPENVAARARQLLDELEVG